MFEAYKDKVIFLVVYVREAHPASASQTAETAGWKAIKDKGGKTYVFHQPNTYEDRQRLAKVACTYWEIPIPTLVDTLDPSVGDVYKSLPNRIYFIGKDGRIIYHGPKGPMGAMARPVEEALRKHFGVTEGEFVTETRGAGGSFQGRNRNESPNREQNQEQNQGRQRIRR